MFLWFLRFSVTVWNKTFAHVLTPNSKYLLIRRGKSSFWSWQSLTPLWIPYFTSQSVDDAHLTDNVGKLSSVSIRNILFFCVEICGSCHVGSVQRFCVLVKPSKIEHSFTHSHQNSKATCLFRERKTFSSGNLLIQYFTSQANDTRFNIVQLLLIN